MLKQTLSFLAQELSFPIRRETQYSDFGLSPSQLYCPGGQFALREL